MFCRAALAGCWNRYYTCLFHLLPHRHSSIAATQMPCLKLPARALSHTILGTHATTTTAATIKQQPNAIDMDKCGICSRTTFFPKAGIPHSAQPLSLAPVAAVGTKGLHNSKPKHPCYFLPHPTSSYQVIQINHGMGGSNSLSAAHLHKVCFYFLFCFALKPHSCRPHAICKQPCCAVPCP